MQGKMNKKIKNNCTQFLKHNLRFLEFKSFSNTKKFQRNFLYPRNVKHFYDFINNKKGVENALNTLVQIIFFAALVLLVALPIIQKYMGILGPSTGEKKALETLVIEINNWEDGKEGSVPIYLKKYVIKGFKKAEEKPGGCRDKDKACLCLCKTKDCDEENNEVKKCLAIDFDLEESYVIIPYEVEKKAKTRNCMLKRSGDDIIISKCIAS